MFAANRRGFMRNSVAALTYGLTTWSFIGLPQSYAAELAKFQVTHTDAEWRKLLTPNQYAVLRKAGTAWRWPSHPALCETIVCATSTNGGKGLL